MDIIINQEQSVFLNSLWDTGFFSNHMRTFFFKLHNNTLGYNVAVAYFVRGHSPLCTFCSIVENIQGPNETPLHLFYECAPVMNLIDNFFKHLTQDDNFEISCREFFSTFTRRELSFAKNKVLTYCSKILIFYIWMCRNRETLPNLENFLAFICNEKDIYLNQSKSFRILWNTANFTIN
jgi:hypothetical protein